MKHPINKYDRNRIMFLKYKKRLERMRVFDDSEGNYHAFKHHGKPCSCSMCRNEKFSRKLKHKQEDIPEEIQRAIDDEFLNLLD